MRIFERDNKINFVDDNNVFVGYDNHQSCCEDADWIICARELEDAKEIGDNKLSPDADYSGFNFDTSFFKSLNDEKNRLDSGGAVMFRLVGSSGEQIFLVLYNCHNGYYGHGFDATIGGQPWHQDVL